MPDIKYFITTGDGQNHQVSEDNIKNYGIDSYANAYKDATIRMRNDKGEDYHVPLTNYNDAVEQGLLPTRFDAAPQKAQHTDKFGNPPGSGSVAHQVVQEYENSLHNNQHPSRQPAQQVKPSNVPDYLDKDRTESVVQDRSSWTNNDFSKQGVNKVHDINTNIQRQQAQDNQPVVNTGVPQENQYIIKTQGQQRQQAEESANNLNNKYISPYVDEALTAADKQARDVIDKSQHLFYGASTGLPQGDVYHAAGMQDPDKILKGLQDNISNIYSDPSFIQNINSEANKIGISSQDYYSKYVQPKIQEQLENTFYQKEILKHMPKNKAEYLINGLTNGITGMALSRLLPAKEVQYMNAAQQATDEGQNGNYTPTTGDKLEKFAVSFATDAPFFGLTGKVASSTVGAVVKNQIEKLTAKGLAEGTARSIVGTQLENSVGKRVASKILQGSLSGATNLGAYNVMSESARQFRDREFNPTQILERGVSGIGTGAALGVTGGIVGGLSSKLSGAKKLLASAANYLTESGTFTATGEAEKYLKGEGKNIRWGQDFLENIEQLGVMKATGGHFMERMKNLVRPESEGVHFTKDEIDHIKTSQSANSLFSALSNMQPKDSKFIKGENTEIIKDPGISEKRKNLSKAYTDFMKDPNNTFVEKQKVAIVLGGTVPENKPLETGYRIDNTDKGITVTTTDENGNAVNMLNFSSEEEANNYVFKHQNSIKANDISIMSENYPEESQRLFYDFIMEGHTEEGLINALSGNDNTEEGTKILNNFQQKLSDRINQVNSFNQGLLTTDPQERQNVKSNLDKQTENVTNLLKEEPEMISSLNLDPESTVQKMRDGGYSEDKINGALDYLNARNTYLGMIKGVRDEINEKVNQNNDKINSITNQSDGLLHPATTRDGEQTYIVSGNVALFDDGTIDHNNSDKSIIIKDPNTGEQKMIPSTELGSIDQTINSEDYAKQQEEDIRNYYSKKASDEIEGNVQITTENGNINQVTVSKTEEQNVPQTDESNVTTQSQNNPDNSQGNDLKQFVSDDGRTIIPAKLEDGTEVFLKNPSQNANNKFSNVDIMYKDEEGNPQTESIPASYIKEIGDPQLLEDYSKSKGDTPVPVAQTESPVTDKPSNVEKDGLVRDEKGIPLYEQSPIESTISDMKKYGADENDILDYSSNMISELEKESKKLSKKKPEFSRDFATYKANKQALADQKEAVEKQKAYWQGLNDAISKPAEPAKPSFNKTTETPIIPTDSKKRNVGKYVKENKQMGDYANLHDRILRGIASGTKFLWNDDGVKKGLSTELGFKGSEGERKKRIGLLANKDKGGVSIDELAHNIWEEREGQPWQNEDVNDIKNEIIDVLLSHNGTRTMIDEAMKMHEQPENSDDSYEAQNYIHGFANSRHIDPEDVYSFDSYNEDKVKNDNEFIGDDELNSIFADKYLEEDKNLQENGKESKERSVQGVRESVPTGEGSTGGSTRGNQILQGEQPATEGSPRQSGGGRPTEKNNVRPEGLSNDNVPERSIPRTVSNTEVDNNTLQESPEEANVKRMSDIQERLSDIDSQLMELQDEGITESPQVDYLNEEKGNLESEYKGLKDINSESERIQRNDFTPPDRENESPLEYAQKVADAHESYKEEQKVDTNPSEAQKEAGDYKKGHIKLDGYDITIENPKGSERSGKDDDGNKSIKPIKTIEDLIREANGDKDEESTKNAQDILKSRGIDWTNETINSNNIDTKRLKKIKDAKYDLMNAKRELSVATSKNTPYTDSEIEEKRRLVKEAEDRLNELTGKKSEIKESLVSKESERESIVNKSKEDGTYMKAPNGKNTNLNEDQWVTVRTQSFKDWFGDWEKDPEHSSKVVDENGEPMVVYHGTLSKNINSFDKNLIGSRHSYDEVGFFFTNKENIAKDYSISEFDPNNKGVVIPTFLNIKKPVVANNKWAIKEGLGNALKNMDSIEFWDNYQSFMIDTVDENKNDGIIIDDESSKMIVAIEPNQIKSATENNGNFSKDNNDIRFNIKGKEDNQDTQLRDALIEKIRNAGIEVITDKEEMKNILQESDKGVKLLKTSNGEAYGFVKDGKIYIDTDIAGSDTPIHEYTHLWSEVLRKENPEEWKNIVSLMKDLPMWSDIRKLYTNLKDDDSLAEEVLATYSGQRGSEKLNKEKKKCIQNEHDIFSKAKIADLFNRVKNAIEKFWHRVSDFLNIHYTTAEDVADQALKDLLNEVNPKGDNNLRSRIKGENYQNTENEDNNFGDQYEDDGKMPLTNRNIGPVLYNMSSEYTRRINKSGVPGMVVHDNKTNFDQAKKDYENIQWLDLYKDELKGILPRCTETAKDRVLRLISEIDRTLDYYKRQAEGEEMWRTEEPPMFRNVEGKMGNTNLDTKETMPIGKKTEDQISSIKSSVDNVSEKLGGVPVKYVDENNIPENIKEKIGPTTKGWYDPKDGSVTLYTPNITSEDDAVRTVFHEKLGHEGLKALFGSDSEVNKFGDFIFKSANKELRDEITKEAGRNGFPLNNPDGMSHAAQEVFARIAEEGPASENEFSLWRKIKHYVIDLLNKSGLHIKGILSDEDLRYYIQKTAEALKNQKLSEGSSEGSSEVMFRKEDEPKKMKGENMRQFIDRLREWNKIEEAKMDKDDPMPEYHPLDSGDFSKDAAAQEKYYDDYRQWKIRHNIYDIEKADDKFYNGEDDVIADPVKDKDIYLNSMDNARLEADPKAIERYAKTDIIERRKLINGSAAEDSLFMKDISDRTDAIAKSLNTTGKDIREALPFMIEGTYHGPIKVNEELETLMDDIKSWHDEMYNFLKEEGLYGEVGYLNNYISHIWDSEKSDAKAFENFVRTKNKYMQHRLVPTYQDGIDLGLVPKYKDVTEIMAEYGKTCAESVANNRLINAFKNYDIVDGDRRDPALSTISAPGYTRISVPGISDYPMTDIWVHNSIKDRFNSVFGSKRTQGIPEWMTKTAHKYDLSASVMKKIQLSVSGFHAVALAETLVGTEGPARALKDVAKYVIKESVFKGLPPAYAHPEDYKLAAKHLVRLGATDDYSIAEIQAITSKMRKIVEDFDKKHPKLADNPATFIAQTLDFMNKGFDTVLWKYIHDGFKLSGFKYYANNINNDFKDGKIDGIERDKRLDEAGQMINDAFGGQFWDVINVSPSLLKWMGRGLLSPDWTISTTRHGLSAMFGLGSLYSESGFQNYLFNNTKRLLGRDIPKNEYVDMRKKWGRQFYAIAFMAIGTMMNAINAYYRHKDEQDEKIKADEMRKSNPDYKSPYELAYPDGMKWYDYTMYGNSVGHQTHLFSGHYHDGTETYVRWGKQLREIPEMLYGRDGLSFPGPIIDRLSGKANPIINLTSNLFSGASLNGFENPYMKNKLGWAKEIGRLHVIASCFLPYSIPTDEEKEFKMTDLFMPSQKGMTRWSTINHFKTAILSGDLDYVGQTYKAAVLNGIDAESCLKAATTEVKAGQRQEMSDGIKSLQMAMDSFDNAKTLDEKKHLKAKIVKYLADSGYKSFSEQEAVDKVKDFLNGDDLKDNETNSDKYIMSATADDIRGDYKISALNKKALEITNRVQEMYSEGESPEVIQQYISHYKKWFEIKGITSGYKSRTNSLKKLIGKEKNAMNMIRSYREETMKRINSVN